MITTEQRIRSVILELQILEHRLTQESDRVDPHFHRAGHEGAIAHVTEAINHARAALSCVTDPHSQ
jgi:hypothetical protein